MSRSSRVKYASVAALLSAAVSSAAPTPIALTGGAAPGGGTYSGFTNAELNAGGQLVFNATVTGGTSTSGIFTGLPGSIQALALQGAAAPSGGGTYGTLSSPATLNVNGTLAFQAPLVGGTATSGSFVGTIGSLQTIALQGTAAPSGGNYNVFAATGINAATAPVLNPSGTVAFESTLSGGNASNGVFVGTPGSLQTAAIVGGAAPGGGTYATTMLAPVINKSAQVAFISLIGSAQGIFAGSVGSIQTVSLTGNAAPGTGGELYGNPTTTYSFNDAGQVGFISTLSGGTPTSGVFVGAPSATGGVQVAALNNTLAPGGTGGNYNGFSNVTVNKNGQAAFTSSLTGGTSASGLFVGLPGSIQALALAGGAANNFGDTFASFASSALQNGNGQEAFIANLAGADVVSGLNSQALLAGTPGHLTTIVRQGDLLDLGPNSGGNEFRTVTGTIGLLINTAGQDGKGLSFNDSGITAFRLSFTDGSSGVFESPIPVPEPASLGLLAVGAGMLLRRNRNRLV